MATIFILDWKGTLDILDNVPRFLKGLREKYPGCRLILNTGMLYSVPNEIRKLFDTEYFKSMVWEILQKNVPEIAHWARVDNPLSAAEINKIVVVDDQVSFGSLEYIQSKFKQEGMSPIPTYFFHSVKTMEKAFNEQQDQES